MDTPEACQWSVYMLRCADNSLYTGITTDVSRRVQQHGAGSAGAKYLKGRTPLRLVFEQRVGDRSKASRVEYRIKQLSKQEKERLLRRPDLLRERIVDFVAQGRTKGSGKTCAESA